MPFNDHSRYRDRHAFLSASKYSWINYDPEKLEMKFEAAMTAALGTRLHALAHELIQLGQRLPDEEKTLNMYVNDAINYRMSSEVTLVYSDNAFGTADAVAYRNNTLRIHDLKNGVTPASFTQLYIYAAFFCLEYGVSPLDIDTVLAIYQNDAVELENGDPDLIMAYMSTIRSFDSILDRMKREAEL